MKDYGAWNKEKKFLQGTDRDAPVFHEREIWWCSLGFNLGDEEYGKNKLFERPVLVLKKFNSKLAWILTMSTKLKRGISYHELQHEEKSFSVLLSQLRLVSAKRFRPMVRKISPGQFRLVKEKVVFLIKKR